MPYADTLPAQRKFGQTTRPDAWWIQPLLVFLGFSAFIVYSTWAALQGGNYFLDNATLFPGGIANTGGQEYLSPFYSPEIWGTSGHSWTGAAAPSWWPTFIKFSPAFLIMWIPAGFRFTCYYYRGAYYKAFWADPINCAVGEPRKKFLGEKYFPLIIQNAHRYFLYLALVFIVLLSHDAWKGLWFTDAMGKAHFGLAVGSLVLILNAVLLGSYTLGCHSLRHLVGGFLDSKSKAPTCAKAYSCVGCLNKKHMMWAWFSLFWVGFTDLYIRLCAMNIWHDYRIF